MKSPPQKLRLHAVYTEGYEVLYRQWFLRTMRDDYELCVQTIPGVRSGTFMTMTWQEAIRRKTKAILQAIEMNWGSEFVFSDVDIQFFGPTEPLLRELLGPNDFACQTNAPGGELNTGFFYAKANDRVLHLWREVSRVIQLDRLCHDQDVLNWLLLNDPRFHGLRRTPLPPSFYSAGTLNGVAWKPGRDLPVPQPIVLHHAAWTIGLRHKIAQLEYVRHTVEGPDDGRAGLLRE